MGLVNLFIAAVGNAIAFILLLLPTSPFTWNLSGNGFVTWLFWLFPISSFVTSITAYVAAVVLYYAIRVGLRWMKVAGS